jgi:peptidoglycan/LPS O-acetylase OafA/YrhL
MEIKKSNERYPDLDFVRAVVMLLGLVLHVSLFFMPPHELFWGTGEYVGDEMDLQFCNVIHLFRMQLFFLMAGFFAQLVIERKSYEQFVSDRFKRIFIPFVVGILVILPVFKFLMNGFGNYYKSEFDGMNFLERFRSVFLFKTLDGVPGVNDNLIHYWFIYYLLILYTAHFLLRSVFVYFGIKKIPGVDALLRMGLGTRWGFLALGLLSFPFQYLLVNISFGPSGFNVPLIDLAFYFVFYLFGTALYVNRHLLANMAKNAWFLIAISVPFIFFVAAPTYRIELAAPVITDITTWTIFDNSTVSFALPVLHAEGFFHGGIDKVVVAFIRASLCWTLCIGFIGLAHRYLKKPQPAIRYLADSAYWVYFIHVPITFKLSFIAQQIEWGSSLFKSYVVLVVSTVIIYWSYNTFIRYGWLGDFFMGRRKSRSDPGEAEFSLLNLIRVSMPIVIVLGGIALLLGAMLRFDRARQGSPVLVEAYVTRDISVLQRCDVIDDIRDAYGNTPLHNAARRPEAERMYNPMPILIAKYKSLNARNEFGQTALFVAVQSGNKSDVQSLLGAGADPNISDQHGHSPAHVAAIKAGVRNPKVGDAFVSMIEVLASRGANLESKDAKGRSVADCLKQFSGRNLKPMAVIGK